MDFLQVDEALKQIVTIYGIECSKKVNAIGPMAVYQLKPGSFASFLQQLVKLSGCSFDQVKMPKPLKRTDHLQYLLDRVINPVE